MSSSSPPPSGGGATDYDRGRVAATAIADQSGYRAASVTVVQSLFVTAVTVLIYRRSLPSPCRDVVVDAVVRRSRVSKISTPRRFRPRNIVGVADRRAMLSRDSFRVDRNRRDGPSAAERAVALLSVRVYDRPDMDVPNYYPGRPSSSVGRLAASCSSASASSATGPRRNAAHVHRRACARRGAMRRAYSTPPSKVRTSEPYNIIFRRCSVVLNSAHLSWSTRIIVDTRCTVEKW